MQAIRVHPAPPSETRYSPTNPAPTTALHNDKIPIPTPTAPNQLLIHIKATTVIRDMLTWPETYYQTYTIPGHDFSGTVASVSPGSTTTLQPGTAVFGMTSADHGSTWASYALVTTDEVALKPAGLGWEEAAALPLSAQTAYEALFVHAGLPLPLRLSGGSAQSEPQRHQEKDHQHARQLGKRVLVTGAAGGVGIFLVQLAARAGMHVVAASGSVARNGAFLMELGADEVVEYADLEDGQEGRFDVVVDSVGGEVLERCWGFVKEGGSLISVDSASFDFVEAHAKRGLRRDGVKALFFIVEGSGEVLRALSELAARGELRSFVAAGFGIDRVKEAYDYANGRFDGRGKVVLTF
ncbi:Polyketide synthase, enoylreductase [Penicillium expansum]|uniref:Polyketide synthase, enoylreductase n=1 Tax=Penicillium expansum TaxID=27334 RepID=A0A0A2JXD9_PENEN|nr:Polyketide synthase, enoylreductase [Penicillium expansum]KGO44263.1 Polyketide synthase, enoylreductase [Penicillium expansum]KGO60089.1 Polyketide synthase, enoylreductase [Penicillium expansum]KGO64883.1 Polyketide synthase, enoylreductase [Penicillium expansum]